MSQKVISDFEVKDSSIASNFTTYDPHGTTISKELTQQIDSLDGLEATGHLYSQVFTYAVGALAVAVAVRAMLEDSWTSTFHFTLLPLVLCTPLLIGFSVLTPYLCFRNLEKQSVVERLRAAD